MSQSYDVRKHYNPVNQVCSVDEVPEFMRGSELQPAGNAAAIDAMKPQASESTSLIDAADAQMEDCMQNNGVFDPKALTCSEPQRVAPKPQTWPQNHRPGPAGAVKGLWSK